MKLSGSVALVTGANRGLGAAFAADLLRRGAAVYAAARDPAQVVAQLGDAVTPLALDVTDPASIRAAAAAAPDVTFLVNNAGRLAQRSLFEQGDLSALRDEMAVNVYGLAEMTLAFAPVIERNGGGGVMNMLSAASLVAFPVFGTYSATKAAAMSLTHSMRWDLGPRGIEVFGVYAGYIDTGMVGNVDAEKTAPQEIARRALDSAESGLPDIPTDPRSEDLLARLQPGFAEILTVARARADAFRRDYPLAQGDA